MTPRKPIYGGEYYCYHKDEFLGIATFTDDQYIGDSFIRMVIHKKRGLEEEVLIPDYWELLRNVER